MQDTQHLPILQDFELPPYRISDPNRPGDEMRGLPHRSFELVYTEPHRGDDNRQNEAIPVRMTVLGAAGGLGRNVVEAAARAGHKVRALVRQMRVDPFPSAVEVVQGDAFRQNDVNRALQGVDATYFCLNPRFSRWLEDFPPLLSTTIVAARETGTRLVFPANVWIYGPGRPGQMVDETRAPSPTSQRGRPQSALVCCRLPEQPIVRLVQWPRHAIRRQCGEYLWA